MSRPPAACAASARLTGHDGESAPPRPPYGLFKSTDGGATFSFVWDGNGTNRGVIDLALDPSTPSIVYAAALNQGTFRSTDVGYLSVLKARLSANDPDRPSFDVTKLPNGNTRMYLGEGVTGNPPARFFRTDDASGAAPVFTDLTTSQNINYCTGQCWYDNVVYTPPGKPDVVYLGGSYDYNNYGFVNNGRAFLRSTDAGASFTDMTYDATTNPTPPGSYASTYPGNSLAPKASTPTRTQSSRSRVRTPRSTAGTAAIRSSGEFSDISGQCSSRPLSGAALALCQQLLSSVPSTCTA